MFAWHVWTDAEIPFIYSARFGFYMTTDEERLTVVNAVASTRAVEELDLSDIAIQLNCEYEPEQFPGVVYRATEPKLAILMFRSAVPFAPAERTRTTSTPALTA